MKNLKSSRWRARARRVLLALAMAAAVPALANYDATITRDASYDGPGPEGSGFDSNGVRGWVNVGEIEDRLNAGTSVTISTTISGWQDAGELWVITPIRWTTGATLTLFAHSEAKIDADIVATGATAGLAITSLGGAAAGYTLRNGHMIILSGAAASLIVGGRPYVWVIDIGVLQAMSPGGGTTR